MLRAMLIAIAAVVAGTGVAGAQAVQNVLQQARLFGLWANDCGRPASAENVHSIYAVDASGQATLRYEFGSGYNPLNYNITSARIAAPGRIVYGHVNLATGAQLTVILVYTETNIRVWNSQRSTGEVLVENGKFTSNGTESHVQWRCN